MNEVIYYVLGAAFLAAVVVLGALLVRHRLRGASLLATFLVRTPGRLEVVEQANVDGRRRLVLIRRDDVEHLVMTGGPVDVVIETGIGVARGGELEEATATPIRQPRSLKQAAGDR